MQKLLTTRDADMMAKLYRYLQQRGVPVTVSENGNQLDLWLTVSSYNAHAKALIQEFKANPSVADDEFIEGAPPLESTSFVSTLLQQAGWFTLGYAVVVIAVYLCLQIPQLQEAMLSALLFNPHSWENLPFTQPWRFITPALLHFSVMHILFNVFWWWYLGGRFERYYGTKWLVLAFAVISIVSNTSQFIDSGPLFGGLSGVVYGLFGIAVVVAWKNPRHPLFLPSGLIGFMLAWLLLGYTGWLWVNIANTAHTAGLVAGLAVGAGIRFLSHLSHKSA